MRFSFREMSAAERRPLETSKSLRSSKEIVVIASVVVSSPQSERHASISAKANHREIKGYSAGRECR